MVKPYLNQLGGVVDTDVSLFTGGLNYYQDKAFLEADQMPYVMNMTMSKPPQIRTRDTRQTLAEFFEGDTYPVTMGTIIDMWSYKKDQFYVITQIGNNRWLRMLYKQNSSDQSYTYQNLIKVPTEDKYYFTLARTGVYDYLYVTGLTFKIKVTLNSNNPLTVVADKIEDGKYGICCCHKGRLFLGMPENNIVTFSALYDYDNFDEMQQYQVVTTPLDMADPKIVYLMQNSGADNLWDTYVWDEDLQTFIQNGTLAKTQLIIDTTTGLSMPDYSVIAGDFKITNSIGDLISLKSFDDKLMIFCEHSMHTLYGDTPDTSMQNQFQLVDLNNNLGALADRCIAIGGGKLFWLGDNKEVYEYTGSAINIISRPGKTRNSTLAIGGVSGLMGAWDLEADYAADTGFSHSKFTATSEKLYINIWNGALNDAATPKFLFIFDIYNRVWWCEDGEFTTIGNYSDTTNQILMAKSNGDILVSKSAIEDNEGTPGKDYVFNFTTNSIEEKPIEYEFHTRVYGADGTDMRKTLSDVWFQARADAEVFISDMWTSFDKWAIRPLDPQNELIKIGTLKYEEQPRKQPTQYNPSTYEQQVCYAPKMYGQRVNAFQIVVKGVGNSKFYLMKREWRAAD